jgi:hypothetical protein
MSYSSRFGSRRNTGFKVQKSANQKKASSKRGRVGAKYLNDESVGHTLQDIIGKTIGSVERLGNQVFALSPFSQYYEDWLINLHQVVSEFEAFPGVVIDEVFVKECEQVFLDIESLLADHQMQEDAVSEFEKSLYTLNQELRVVEMTYAESSRVLNNKRNIDTQRLTNEVKALEEDVANQENLKFGTFQFGAKKAAAKQLEQTQSILVTAKKQLETISQNFTLEHDKLHVSYVAKKQELSTKSEILHKKIEQTEIDPSIESRRKTCTHLNNIINELIKRLPTTDTNPSN